MLCEHVFSIDPAVTDETTGKNLDPALDMYNPKNGFNPKASTQYSQEFIDKFSARGEKDEGVDCLALDRSEKSKREGKFPDDEPFIIPVPVSKVRIINSIPRTSACGHTPANPGRS